MGVTVSRWWWGGDPDKKDEISGMTLRDIYNVQRSWKIIQTNSYDNGFLMFYRFFEAEPETKLFFKQIANLHTEEEMRANVSFKAHILNIMASLDNSIMNLHRPEIVVVWMHKLGDSHQRHSVEKRHFWIFKDVIVNILKNDLKFSDDVLASWDRYITFIYDRILTKLTT